METLTTQYLISEEDADQRLDRWLAGRLPEHSRSVIQGWIEAGYVLLDAAAVKPSTKLTAGSQILLKIPEKLKSLKPIEVPLKIVFEDDDLIVIDKQIGLVVHPGADNFEGTLVQGLLYLKKSLSQLGGEERPGVVHRLDKETSGVIVLAKTDLAYESLVQQFQNREVKKFYLALVHGRFAEKSGRIDADLGRDFRHTQKIKIRLHGGKPAITDFDVINEIDALTLLLVKPLTGRTHQIRVHLNAIDHWVVGDSIYGRKSLDPKGTFRMMLHAWRLRLRHPRSGEELEFSAPFPAEFEPFWGDRLWESVPEASQSA